MKEFLHLFTPVTEALPELTEHAYWYNDNNEREIRQHNDHAIVLALDPIRGIIKCSIDKHRQWREIASGYNGPANPTHWLDLSKLTTKEAAIRLASNSYKEGLSIDKGAGDFESFEEFIHYNKVNL